MRSLKKSIFTAQNIASTILKSVSLQGAPKRHFIPIFEPLLFPEFFKNTVVPERKLLKRWGTHRGWAERGSRPFRGRKR